MVMLPNGRNELPSAARSSVSRSRSPGWLQRRPVAARWPPLPPAQVASVHMRPLPWHGGRRVGQPPHGLVALMRGCLEGWGRVIPCRLAPTGGCRRGGAPCLGVCQALAFDFSPVRCCSRLQCRRRGRSTTWPAAEGGLLNCRHRAAERRMGQPSMAALVRLNAYRLLRCTAVVGQGDRTAHAL